MTAKPFGGRWGRSVILRNVGSGFLTLGWMSFLSLASIPLYIRVLGVAEWGLVAACASLQIIFAFIDAGCSQIVPRWVARETARDPAAVKQLLALFRKIYATLAVVGCLALQALAGPLAHLWFQVDEARTDALELAIRITAVQLMFQFFNSLLIGIWNGLQLQVAANVRSCLFVTLKHVAAFTALLWLGQHAVVYAAAFALVALLEVTANARAVSRMADLAQPDAGAATHGVSSRAFFKEASMLSLGILVGLATSQLDRVVLSRTESIDSFGIYVVVANLSLAFLQLQAPLTRAYFPRLVQEVHRDGLAGVHTFAKMTAGNILVAVVPALAASMFAEVILHTWIRNPEVALRGSQALQWLLWAVAANALYGCIYQVIVAAGRGKLVLYFNAAALAAGCIIVAVGLQSGWGLALGGAIWLASTMTQFILGFAWLLFFHRRGRLAAENHQR